MTGRIVRVSGLELQLRRTGRGRVEISYRGRVLGVVEEDRSVHVASSGGARVRPASAKPAPPNARHARRNGGPRRRRSRPDGWTCWRGGPSWTTCEVAYGCTLRKAVASWHGRHPQCVACALGSHARRAVDRGHLVLGRVSDRLRRLASLPDPHRPARK